jgi:conjugal transfer/entry exclusion protein
LLLVEAVGDLRNQIKEDAVDRARQTIDISSIHEKLDTLTSSVASIDKVVSVTQTELNFLKKLPSDITELGKSLSSIDTKLSSIDTKVDDYPKHRDKINEIDGELKALRTVNIVGSLAIFLPILLAMFTLMGVKEDTKSLQSKIQEVEKNIQQIQGFSRNKKP